MGFIIIGICGFVLGIIAVVLLAVVGYFAEKKNVGNEIKLNNQNSNVINNTVQSDNAINDVPIDSGIVTFDELPNVNKKLNDIVSDLSDSNIKKEEHEEVKDEPINSSKNVEVSSPNLNDVNISSDISDFSVSPVTPVVDNSEISTNSDNQINTENSVEDKNDEKVFSLNNFENVEMSLDDLEKKNYDEISNENNSNDDENYYYSNLEENSVDTPIDELADNSIQNNSEDIQEPISDKLDDTVIENNSELGDVQSTNDVISASDFFNSESAVDNSTEAPVELSNEVPAENVEVPAELNSEVPKEVVDTPVELNNEIPTDTIETPIEEVSNDINAVQSKPYSESVVDDSTEVPEVFDGEVASTDDEGNSVNEIPTETYSNDIEVPEMSEGGFSISDDSTDDDIWKF